MSSNSSSPQLYVVTFRGIRCAGCVQAVQQKILTTANVKFVNIQPASGTLYLFSSLEPKILSQYFQSFTGCCTSCTISLDTINAVQPSMLSQATSLDVDPYSVVKTQYQLALEQLQANKEVACSEHCVCKTTGIDRVHEFPEAPSFATIYNLIDYIKPFLYPGMSAIDIGCGTGHDALRLAPLIHPGLVYGYDVTSEMIQNAQVASQQLGVTNTVFEVAHDIDIVPVQYVDLIYMNSVFNIISDKKLFLRHVHKKLKTTGIFIIADELAVNELPDAFRADPALQCGTLAGAETEDKIRSLYTNAGFQRLEITSLHEYMIVFNHTHYVFKTSMVKAEP